MRKYQEEIEGYLRQVEMEESELRAVIREVTRSKGNNGGPAIRTVGERAHSRQHSR